MPRSETAPDIFRMLRAGGDERLALDPLTRRDGYGCLDRPDEGAVLFSSSTASPVSARGLGAAEAAWPGLSAAPERGFDAIRERILGHLGARDAECILAASGTDAELIALALASAAMRRPITNIVLAPCETGRGVALAADGRHFQGSAPFAPAAVKGARLTGWEDADIRAEVVDIRDEAGAPRAAAALEAEVEGRVRAAIAAGRGALVHLLDVSKTGLSGLGLPAARRIADAAPDRTMVLADCCQLRAAPERLAGLIAAGFVVATSGSKFAGGPPFSGALLAPRNRLADLDASRLPAGLAAHVARLDLPPRLRAALGGFTPNAANFGLGLRWVAALGELERLAAVDPALVTQARARFRADVAAAVARLGNARLEPCQGDATRWPETIATVRMRGGDGEPTSEAQAQAIRAALREPIPGAGVAALRRFLVGQPVAIGGDFALRVSLSAPLINAIADRVETGMSFETAFAPLAHDIGDLFDKWTFVAERSKLGRRA